MNDWEEMLTLSDGHKLMRLKTLVHGSQYRLSKEGTWGPYVATLVAEELLRLAQSSAEAASLQEEIPAALSRLNRRLEDLESRLRKRISDLEVVAVSRRSERAECLDDHDRRLLALETEARTVEETIRRLEKEKTSQERPSPRESDLTKLEARVKTLEEAPSEWMEHLADAGNRICSRVEALEKTVGVVAAESAIRVEPLRRLAERAKGAGMIMSLDILRALREAGVLSQDPAGSEAALNGFGERLRQALQDTGPMNGAWWRPALRRIAQEIDDDAARLAARIAELEAEKAALTEDLEGEEEEVASLEEALSALREVREAEIRSLEEDLERADSQLRECALSLMDGSEIPVEHEDLVEAVKSRAAALEAKLESLREENAALKDRAVQSAEPLEAELAVLDKEIQAWTALEDRARVAIDDAEAVVEVAEDGCGRCWEDMRSALLELTDVVRAFLADEEEDGALEPSDGEETLERLDEYLGVPHGE